MYSSALPKVETAPFNFEPLTAPIRPGLMAEFKRTHRVWWPMGRQTGLVAWSSVVLLVLGFCLLLVAAGAVFLLGNQVFHPFSFLTLVLTVCGLAMLSLVAYPMIAGLREGVRFGPGWKRMLRLDWFAYSNGMTYQFEQRNPRLSGSVFTRAKSSVAQNVLTVKSGRGVQIGNFVATRSTGLENVRVTGGYVVIELDRRMPHMMAISKKRRGLRRRPLIPALLRSQTLSLEGDFDKYFTLYAPKQYEQDALYVFTPDLMALLIDRLGTLDLEIVDNLLFLYSATPFNLLDPATHERLASIVQVVGHKAANQTRNYSDHRTDPRQDVVGVGGRRLRYGASAGTVILIIYVVIRLLAAFHGA